jgi:hypothetical protein
VKTGRTYLQLLGGGAAPVSDSRKSSRVIWLVAPLRFPCAASVGSGTPETDSKRLFRPKTGTPETKFL